MSYSKTQSIKNRFSLKTINYSLGYCPITGILLEVKIPSLPSSMLLSYKNPLANIENSKALFSIPYKELASVPNNILAGCLLSVLTHYDLITDKLSSIERNDILSEYPSFTLYNTAKDILSYSDSRIAGFPSLSLTEALAYYIPSLLKNYLEACRTSGNYFRREDTIEITRTITSKVKAKKSLEVSTDQRKEVKALVSRIISEEVLTPKLVTLLKVITQGNTLMTMSAEFRTKLVAKLDTFECAAAVILSNLISSFIPEKEEEQEFSATNYGTRKTLKEIIAEKKALGQNKIEESALPPSLLSPEIEEQEEQKENLDLENYPDDEELSEGEEEGEEEDDEF